MIEIVLVVILLGVVTAMAIPNFSQSYARLQVETVARGVSDVMRYAQGRAISRGRTLQLVFDAGMRSYWLLEGPAVPEQPLSADQEQPDEPVRIQGRWGRTFEIPFEISVDASSPSVEFCPDGKISKVLINFCRGDECLVVSTQEQRGMVSVLEAS